MFSTLSQETIHGGVLDAYDIGQVDSIEGLERVGVSSRIGVRTSVRPFAGWAVVHSLR
jgi:hypothetical protein